MRQVIISFALGTGVSIIIALVGLLSGSVPHFRREPIDRVIIHSLKAFLNAFLNLWPRPVRNTAGQVCAGMFGYSMHALEVCHLRRKPRNSKLWEEFLEQTMLVLNDQMMVSGFAVLVVAFARRNDLSAYHFTILSDLGWMASNAHQTAIILVYQNMRENKLVQFLRLLVMWATAAMLLATAVILPNKDWRPTNYTCQSVCLFWSNDPDARTGGPWLGWLIVHVFLILYGYLRQTFLMLKLNDGSIPRFYDRMENFIVEKKFKGTLVGFLLHLAGRFVVALSRFFDSFIVDFVQQLVWYVIGLYVLAVDRDYGSRIVRDSENIFGVGQILPLVLLLVPILSLLEIFEGMHLPQLCMFSAETHVLDLQTGRRKRKAEDSSEATLMASKTHSPVRLNDEICPSRYEDGLKRTSFEYPLPIIPLESKRKQDINIHNKPQQASRVTNAPAKSHVHRKEP